MTKQSNVKIEKEKFALVNQQTVIYDGAFETKNIGLMKDAFLRFKRNKSSIIGFIIVAFLLFMAILMPMLSSRKSTDENINFSLLPPRIPLVEKLGILNGTVKRENVPLSLLGTEQYPEGTYKRIGEPYTITTNQGGVIVTIDVTKIKFDLYKFTFGERKIIGITEMEFNAIDPEAIISFVRVEDIVNGSPTVAYNVVVNYMKYLGYSSVPYFPFGTDGNGRDLWTRLWVGTRMSFMIGIIVAAISLTIGVLWGAISGYYGGVVDIVAERIVEIISGIPLVVIMTLMVLNFGKSAFVVITALALTGWIGTASTTRMQFYRYKGYEYVLAARTLGAKDRRIIWRHILPNAIGPLITSAVLVIPGAIFAESNLSYLGLGPTDIVSIGMLLSNGQGLGIIQYPHLTVFPAIVISLLMIAFNLFGNGLRDAFNPSLRGSE